MAAGDLITLPYLKVALESDSTASDAKLEQLVTQASSALVDYTGREYVGPAAAEERVFPVEAWWSGAGILVGDLADPGTITAAQLETASGTPTVLTPATAFRWLPVGRKPGEPYEAVDFAAGVAPARGGLLRITAEWGWVTDPDLLPERVKRAAVVTVEAWLRRSPAAWDAVEAEDGRLLYPSNPDGWALPMAAKQLVARDRRRGIG